jgi:hypothetical protein
MSERKMLRSPLGAIALATVAGVGVIACGGGDSADGRAQPTAVTKAPAPPPLADTAAARVHYFGAENVDAQTGEIRKDLLIMSWVTNTTYAAAINGKVVLMDAALLRREVAPGRTPTTLDELVQLMPSYILIGKAAPGHVDLAANIAFRTGATVIGAQEYCDAVQEDARRQQGWPGNSHVVKCHQVAPRNQDLGKKVNALDLPDLGVCLRTVKHSDQLTDAADPSLPPLSFDWSVGSDLRDPSWWPVGVAAQDGIGTSAGSTGPSLVYHLTLAGGRSFGLAWNDRVGSLKENGAGVTELLRSLPKTDLHVGSVDAGNAMATGLRDPARYVQALEPKIFFAAGHDAASQRAGAYNTAEFMKRALESALSALSVPMGVPGTEMRVNFDPTDYVKPHYMTFDPSAPAWQRDGDRAAAAICE